VQLDKSHIMNVMQLRALIHVLNFLVYTKVCYTLHHAFQRCLSVSRHNVSKQVSSVILLPTCKKKAWK